MREDLWGIARPKDLMDGSKVCSPLLMGEVWGEYTAIDTLPAQKLARSTGVHKGNMILIGLIDVHFLEMNGEGLKQSNLQEKSPKSFLCSSVLPPAIPTAGDLEAVKEQHLGSFHYNFDSSYVPLFCCLLAGK